MKTKKAQAAMEYIFVYGWVLLSLLAILGVLSYFGISRMADIVPERCEFLSGLDCIDVTVVDNYYFNGTQDLINETHPKTMIMVIQNEFGFDITNMSIMIEGDCNAYAKKEGFETTLFISDKSNKAFEFDCGELPKKIEQAIYINLTNAETSTEYKKKGYMVLNR